MYRHHQIDLQSKTAKGSIIFNGIKGNLIQINAQKFL